MTLINLSDLNWVPGRLMRNQAIFLELLKTGYFTNGIYINPPKAFAPRDLKRSLPSVIKINTIVPSSNISIMQALFSFPFTWRSPVKHFTAKRLANYINRSIIKNDNYVIWMNGIHELQSALYLALGENAKYKIFDSSDNFVAFATPDHQPSVKRTLAEILSGTDTTVCVNEEVFQLLDHKRKIVFHNCTSFGSLQRTHPEFRLTPILPKDKTRRIVGFTGGLQRGRVDMDLLNKLFVKFPDVLFVFVGYANSAETIAFIRQYPNGVWLEAVEYQYLSDVIRSFDAAIVPHLDNDHTRGNDLLKLRDYMACGVPIVSTKCSNVEKFGNAVLVAESHDQFLSLLASVIDGRYVHSPDKGFEIAREQSWDVQVPRLARQLFGDVISR